MSAAPAVLEVTCVFSINLGDSGVHCGISYLLAGSLHAAPKDSHQGGGEWKWQ